MPKKFPYSTNEELVAHMMRFSNFGALSQMFIVDAITKAAEAVANSKPEDYPPERMMMVTPEAWIGVAQEIKATMDEFYNRHNAK
jgi:hypothetical protein